MFVEEIIFFIYLNEAEINFIFERNLFKKNCYL